MKKKCEAKKIVTEFFFIANQRCSVSYLKIDISNQQNMFRYAVGHYSIMLSSSNDKNNDIPLTSTKQRPFPFRIICHLNTET